MDQGAFIYRDCEDNELCLFLFKKLSEKQMNVALPSEESNQSKGEYFIAILRNGLDYLGRTEYSGIENLLKDQIMYDAFLPYEELEKNISNFSEDEHIKYKKFILSKLETFGQITELVDNNSKKNDMVEES